MIEGRTKARWLVIVVIATAAVAAAGAANADHAAGTHYRGTNSGGGIVEFTVSEDGSSVSDFRYTALPEFCSIEEQIEAGPVAIVNHTFSFDAADFMSFSGSFPGPGSATGTVTPKTIVTACDTLTWTASSGVGGVAELPDVDRTAALEAGESSGLSARAIASIAGATAGVVLLTTAAWYARRRHAA